MHSLQPSRLPESCPFPSSAQSAARFLLREQPRSARNAKLTIFRQRKGRRRPKIIQPALALANFGAQPGFVVINAFLRTKALERSPMPNQAELAIAVSAVIFHNISGLSRHSRGRGSSVSATSVVAFGPLRVFLDLTHSGEGQLCGRFESQSIYTTI